MSSNLIQFVVSERIELQNNPLNGSLDSEPRDESAVINDDATVQLFSVCFTWMDEKNKRRKKKKG